MHVVCITYENQSIIIMLEWNEMQFKSEDAWVTL